MIRRTLPLPLLCAALAACASPLTNNAAEATVSVYKSRGGLQCENNAIAVTELERQLKDAGIRVAATACGHDGRMRPQMCGRPDGNIAIFEIPANKLDAAVALKFMPMDAAKDASRGACS
jgi:hypothetical protein